MFGASMSHRPSTLVLANAACNAIWPPMQLILFQLLHLKVVLVQDMKEIFGGGLGKAKSLPPLVARWHFKDSIDLSMMIS